MDQLLADAAERIRREAYSAGWRDAIAAVNKAAAALVDSESQFDADLAAQNSVPVTIHPASREGEPTTGSTPWYVLQAVRRKPGMTGSEVVSVVQESGHKVSEASIRTSLTRLERRKHIVSRHRKWFPS